MKIKLGTPKLVCGVGVNDADYVVTERETIEVNGVRKRRLELSILLSSEQTDERVGKALIERYTNYTNSGETNEN